MRKSVVLFSSSLVLLVAAACDKPAGEASTPAAAPVAAAPTPAVAGKVDITVNDEGFAPAEVLTKKGEPLQMTFTRKSTSVCGEEVVLPAFNIRKKLPLNEPVVVDITPESTGRLAFTCGMDMMRGAIVVQ